MKKLKVILGLSVAMLLLQYCSKKNEKIEEMIAKLPPLQREVLILREFEELSYLEIAGITETDLGQVKIRLFRARKNLAKELKPYFEVEKEKYYEVS